MEANKVKPLVLIVEDDKINSMVVNKFLGNDYECKNAYNGRDAIEMAESVKYDLFLMDISLGDPEYDGIKVMHKIKKSDINANAKFIAITSFAMQGDKQELLSQGFDDYMSKPIYKQQLLSIIQKHLS